MRIELSLTADYCPSWGVWEGVRELVQNWLDQRDARSDKGLLKDTVECVGGELVLTNWYCELHPSDLGLLGASNKVEGARGRWGEGLKIGALALLREGKTVCIRTDRWEYRATIEQSTTFEAPVLTFTRHAGREPIDGVQVVVGGYTASMWNEDRARFLDLQPCTRTAKTCHGEALLDPAFCGKIFCKGVYVCTRDNLSHGYNFDAGLELNRDRDMVSDFNLRWKAALVERELLKDGHKTPEETLAALERGSDEVHHLASTIYSGDKAALVEAFESKYGPNAIVGDAEAGLTGIQAPRAMQEMLSQHRADKLAAQVSEVQGEVHPGTLLHDEQERLNAVLFALEAAGHQVSVQLAVFAHPNARSILKNGLVMVSVSTLTSRVEFLKAVVSAMPVDDADVYAAIVAASRGWE